MSAYLLAAAFVASAVVVLTPGPAVLAALTLGASRGRRAGAGFIFGHLAGDLVWTLLALVALVWANLLSARFFTVLGFFCAGYLAYLGVRALLVRKQGAARSFAPGRPVWTGVLFGLSNPKSYPVTLSLFTALLGEQLGAMTLEQLPVFLLSCFAGFVAADMVLIWLIGLPLVARVYARHRVFVSRTTGLVFLYFAASILRHSFG